MPTIHVSSKEKERHDRHTDEMQDIITAIPAWILRWGTSLFLIVLTMTFGLSALIRYPDMVHASLVINSSNSAKPIVAKVSGKLVKLLVKDHEFVKIGEPLAYIESTGSHIQVLCLVKKLKSIQKDIDDRSLVSNKILVPADYAELGELQPSFQTFYQEYFNYTAAIKNGFYIERRNYLQKDLANLVKQQAQLNDEKKIQQRDLTLAEQEFQTYLELYQKKVATRSELRSEESKYLAKKSVLVQTKASIIIQNTNFIAKQNEILELDNQIIQEKAKFSQALNSLISQAEEWISKYILMASESGKLSYAGIIEQNQVLSINQDVFYVDPGDEQFFGEMMIPQNSMGKVKPGQPVLIKLRSYPFEEYGMLRGSIQYISDVPFRDSAFFSKVSLKLVKKSDMSFRVHLKQGMLADAEIITQNATILQRIGRSIIKIVNNK